MTTSRPIVGLTLNYRDATRTLRCVKSLLSEGAVYVLIWDNSGDGGVSADSLQKKLEHETRVEVVRNSTNLGFAAGVNRGIALIKEQFDNVWVLLINNDAILLPGAMGSIVAALAKQTRAVIAYPDIDNDGYVVGTVYYQRHTGILSRKPLPGSLPHGSGCCVLIAPERIETKLFDEDFFMYGEDAELGARLGDCKMVHVPQTLVFHEGSASSGLGSEFYENRMVAAHWLLARKLAKNSGDYLLLIMGRLFALTLRGVLRALRYRSLIPLRALLHGWRTAKTGYRR